MATLPNMQYVGKDANGNPLTGWALAADMQKYAGQGYSPYTDPYLNNNTALSSYEPAVQAQRDQQNHLGGFLGDGFFGNLASFNLQNGKSVLEGIFHDPLRAVTGIDPASTKLWNTVLGTDNKPLVGQLGGATEDDFNKARANGIHVDGGVRTTSEIANVVAGTLGTMGLMGALGGAGGAAGGAGGAAAAGTGAEAGLGGLAATGTVAGEAGGAVAGLGGAAAAGGAAAIPTVSVVGAAGGAGAGLGGLGAAAAGAAGAGLGAMANSGGSTNGGNHDVDPNIPQVNVTGTKAPTGLGNLGNPSPVIPLLTPGDVSAPTTDTHDFQDPVPMTSTGSNTGLGSALANGAKAATQGSSLTDAIKGIGSLVGGYSDYKMNQADKDYYQQLMDKMMGMYQPGTPEAGLMENKMRAQDAAAGRNSQYGIRADNLAAQLADNRSRIMTSPSFEKMAEASRGHYDSSLAGLSSILGTAGTSGTGLNSIINTIGSGIANSSLGTSLSDWYKSFSAPSR